MAKKVFMKAKANATKGSILKDVREIASKSTGEIHNVLVFDDAEVVMPGTWTIRESDFPDGIYEGQKLAAYWEYDENLGRETFHMYEVD